ncbi:MAG: laminin G domain-containing protein [Lentisphaeria bacterium]|nr:laminin G domain-containing protein [Lentisphaeria bacterium]
MKMVLNMVLALAAGLGSGLAAPVQAERTEVTSSLRVGPRPRVTAHTLIYARMQPYDLYGNYLDNWIDRPLYHRRSWRDQDPSLAFRRDAEAVLEYGAEGFTILGNAYATRYQEALAMLQRAGVKPEQFSFMAGLGSWNAPWERQLNNARWAAESPYTLRINGKIPFFPYLGVTAEVLGELRGKMREAGFPDQLYLTSAWLGLFAQFNQGGGVVPEASLAEARQALREKLSYADGVVLISYHMHRDPAGDYTLMRRFYPELDEQYVSGLVDEVYREPVGQGKLLGVDVRHGYVGHMSGTNEAELGTAQLRSAMDSALLFNPDIISMVEWNEANENTSFQTTVCNSRSLQRLMRFYARKLKSLPTLPNPGDDLTVPNLVVSVRRTVRLGEKYRLELLNIPDTDEAGSYTVRLTLVDEHGVELYAAPAPDVFEQNQLTAITYTLPSEAWPAAAVVIPRLAITYRGREQTVDALRHTRLEASLAWDYKEIRMPLRDMLAPQQAEFELRAEADGRVSLSGRLKSPEALVSVEVLDHDVEQWAYDRNAVYDQETMDTVVITAARRETVTIPASIAVRGCEAFVWQPWGRPYSGFGQLAKTGDKLEGELLVWATGAKVVLGIPRRVADAELAIDLGEYGRFAMPLAKLRQLRHYAAELEQQTMLSLELRTRLPDHPVPADTSELAFKAELTPEQGAGFYHVRAISASGRIYRSRPLLVQTPATPVEPLKVFSATASRVETVQTPSSRILAINYRFSPEHGGVLLNPGAPAWNGELGSGFRYIYPAWKNTPPPETGRLSPSWSQDGAEWVLDFDGVGNYLVLPMDAFPTGAFTLRFACRTSSDGNMALFNHAGHYAGSLYTFIENGKLTAGFTHMGRNLLNPIETISTDLDFPAGQWNQVEIAYDLQNIRLTVNDQSVTRPLNLRAAKPGTAWFGGVRTQDKFITPRKIGFFQGQLKSLQIRHNAAL